jgi:hypothetical protein
MGRWQKLIRGIGRVPDKVVIEDAAPAPAESDRGHDHIDFFWGYAEEGEDLTFGYEYDPTPVPEFASSQTPTEEQSEFMRAFTDFTPWETRKPIPPKSAVLVPRPLNEKERIAISLADVLDGVKLKGALKKKVVALAKGEQRVVFDATGNMKVVKNGA